MRHQLESDGPGLVHDPPNLVPGAIRDLAAIVVGQKYERYHKGTPSGQTFTVLEAPIKRSHHRSRSTVAVWVRARFHSDWGEHDDDVSMEDSGVVPYDTENGPRWNPSNCLLPASRWMRLAAGHWKHGHP